MAAQLLSSLSLSLSLSLLSLPFFFFFFFAVVVIRGGASFDAGTAAAAAAAPPPPLPFLAAAPPLLCRNRAVGGGAVAFQRQPRQQRQRRRQSPPPSPSSLLSQWPKRSATTTRTRTRIQLQRTTRRCFSPFQNENGGGCALGACSATALYYGAASANYDGGDNDSDGLMIPAQEDEVSLDCAHAGGDDNDDSNNSNNEKKPSRRRRLSRPERKALERDAKKMNNKNNKNDPPKMQRQRQRQRGLGRRQQRIASASASTTASTASLSSLLNRETSTADDVVRAIKRAQNSHDAEDLRAICRFLLEQQSEPQQPHEQQPQQRTTGNDDDGSNATTSSSSSYYYGYRGSLLARLAVAALHANQHDVARSCISERSARYRSSMLPMESAAIVRGLLRVRNVTDALAILDSELAVPVDDDDDLTTSPLPSPNDVGVDCQDTTTTTANAVTITALERKDLFKHRALSLASVASRHFFGNEPVMAVAACRRLAELGPLVRTSGLTADELGMPWARVLRGAAQCESYRRSESGRRRAAAAAATAADTRPSRDSDDEDDDQVVVSGSTGTTAIILPCNVVYAVLNAMTTFPSENNDRVYEVLSNALVRRVVFVTGAVSMDGCPEPDRGEAVLIGRSNVGKSSLINMVTNRKSLAYTSKRPGKTQQFNFFAVNDKPDRDREIKYGDAVGGTKDDDSFYLVDLPGFGFAKVPGRQRNQWLEFMREYVANRTTLRVVFHLIDGRQGPSVEDAAIMKQIGRYLPDKATYVVVITKSDKNVKGGGGREGGVGGSTLSKKKNKNNSKKRSGKVSQDFLKSLRTTMNECGIAKAPVIVTSAETRLGRDDMWRYLRLAAEA